MRKWQHTPEKGNLVHHSVGGHNTRNLGSCRLYVHHRGDIRAITFEVTEVPDPAMSGCKTCTDLELRILNWNLTQKRSNQIPTRQPAK